MGKSKDEEEFADKMTMECLGLISAIRKAEFVRTLHHDTGDDSTMMVALISSIVDLTEAVKKHGEGPVYVGNMLEDFTSMMRDGMTGLINVTSESE